MARIYKYKEGYKIIKSSFWEIVFRKPKLFVQASKNRGEEASRDLVFSSKEHALKYLEIERDYLNLKISEEDYLFAAQNQLETIFSQFKVSPKEYSWSDLWTGQSHWAIVLSRMVQKKVLAIDLDASSYGDRISDYNNLVDFKLLNTEDTPLPEEITAAFLRSTINRSSILRILELNPQLDLLVIIPEGLNSNEGLKFASEKNLLKQYFTEAYSETLSSEFTIKGSHSNILAYNRQFPVLIGRNRKKL